MTVNVLVNDYLHLRVRRYRFLEIKAQNHLSIQKFNNENKSNVIKFTLGFLLYFGFTLKSYYWLGAQLNEVVG